MIDPFKPAATVDGDCEFIAVSTLRPLDTDIRNLRRRYAPRLAVLVTADRIIFLARFRNPCPPLRALGMAFWLAREVSTQHGLDVLQIAPVDVLTPIKLTPMDRYRIKLSSCGHLEFPTADVPPGPILIPRRDAPPLPIVARAVTTEGGAA